MRRHQIDQYLNYGSSRGEEREGQKVFCEIMDKNHIKLVKKIDIQI